MARGERTFRFRRSRISTTVTSSGDGQIAALSRRWKRSRTARGYEPFEVLPEVPLSLVFGPARPKRLMLVTKDTLLRRVYDDLHRFPQDWVIASRPGIPGLAHASTIASLARQLDLPVRFVGDIAPFDIHVFLEYRRLLSATDTTIQWAGIGGVWLQKCGRTRIALAPIERKHRDQLIECVPALPHLVGQDVWEVLESGEKLTLEAASGTATYGPGIHRAIIRSLHGRGLDSPTSRP
jgi:hypothetical protein